MGFSRDESLERVRAEPAVPPPRGMAAGKRGLRAGVGICAWRARCEKAKGRAQRTTITKNTGNGMDATAKAPYLRPPARPPPVLQGQTAPQITFPREPTKIRRATLGSAFAPTGQTASSTHVRSAPCPQGKAASPKRPAGGRLLLVSLPPSIPSPVPNEVKRRTPAPCSWGGRSPLIRGSSGRRHRRPAVALAAGTAGDAHRACPLNKPLLSGQCSLWGVRG